MKDLIKITEKDGQQVVSARELYLFLGLDKSNWSRWYKKNIVDNEFAIENIDYQGFVFQTNGNNVQDFALTIDFAKKLSMMTKSEQGEKARQYFIECEKKLKQLILPRTYKEALQHLIAQVELNEKLLLENEEMRPKADFYDTIIEVGKNVDMGEVAKLLNKGFGRNKLFELLRDKKILMRNNLPYQKYVDLGYFEVVEISKPKANGDLMVFTKTLVTQKGLDYINKVTN